MFDYLINDVPFARLRFASMRFILETYTCFLQFWIFVFLFIVNVVSFWFAASLGLFLLSPSTSTLLCIAAPPKFKGGSLVRASRIASILFLLSGRSGIGSIFSIAGILTGRRTLESGSLSKSLANFYWIAIVVLARGRSASHVKLMTSSRIKGTLRRSGAIITGLNFRKWNSYPCDSKYPVDKIGNFMCGM